MRIVVVFLLIIASTSYAQNNDHKLFYKDLRVPVTLSKSDGSKEPAFDYVRGDGENSHGVFTY